MQGKILAASYTPHLVMKVENVWSHDHIALKKCYPSFLAPYYLTIAVCLLVS